MRRTYEEGSSIKVYWVVTLCCDQGRNVNWGSDVSIVRSVLGMILATSSRLLTLCAGAHPRSLVLKILLRNRRHTRDILTVIVLVVKMMQVGVGGSATNQAIFLFPRRTRGSEGTFPSCRLCVFAMFLLAALTYLVLLTVALTNGLYIGSSILYRSMRGIKVGYDLL